MKKNIYVVGAVIMKDGEVLCAQRGRTKTLPYKWEIPGGKIDAGESLQEALRREINEGMLCKDEVGEQIEHTVYEYDCGSVNLTTLYCDLIEGEAALTKHEAIEWWLANDLFALGWAPADIPTVEKIAS